MRHVQGTRPSAHLRRDEEERRRQDRPERDVGVVWTAAVPRVPCDRNGLVRCAGPERLRSAVSALLRRLARAYVLIRLEPLDERRPRDAEELCGAALVAAALLHG